MDQTVPSIRRRGRPKNTWHHQMKDDMTGGCYPGHGLRPKGDSEGGRPGEQGEHGSDFIMRIIFGETEATTVLHPTSQALTLDVPRH